MSTESLVSIAVSAAALIVSLVALYAQFFRKRARLRGILVEKDYNKHPSFFQYALANTGDVQILVRKVSVDGKTLTFRTVSADVPCVIAPGEVKLVTLKITAGEFVPIGVQFTVVSANGTVFEATHSVEGVGLEVLRNSPFWDSFPIAP